MSPGLIMINEKDREKKSGSAICWVRDTEKIIKSNETPRSKATRYLFTSKAKANLLIV